MFFSQRKLCRGFSRRSAGSEKYGKAIQMDLIKGAPLDCPVLVRQIKGRKALKYLVQFYAWGEFLLKS